MSNYRSIANLGQSTPSPSSNPLTYCLLQTTNPLFDHGGIAGTISGANSKNCQTFMAEYCAKNWNGVCEFKSQDKSVTYPNSDQSGAFNEVLFDGLTAGDVLVANTAKRKYLTAMGNCKLEYQPFDPTVASSPMISNWAGVGNRQGNRSCVPVYQVDPAKIDKDPVMNKILDKPEIAWSLLVNIYNTAVRKGTLKDLKGTRLYAFFMANNFQQYMNQTRSLKKYACSVKSC